MDKTDSDGEKEKACCERALALNRQSRSSSRTEKTKRRKKKIWSLTRLEKKEICQQKRRAEERIDAKAGRLEQSNRLVLALRQLPSPVKSVLNSAERQHSSL